MREAVALLTTVLLAAGCPVFADAGKADAERACPLTPTRLDQPPDDPNADPFPRSYWYINEARSLWAGWDAASLRVGTNKVLWIRPAGSELHIDARHLDAAPGDFEADVPCCYPTGFQVSGLRFSKPGCWEITASAGGATLTFTTLVGVAKSD